MTPRLGSSYRLGLFRRSPVTTVAKAVFFFLGQLIIYYPRDNPITFECPIATMSVPPLLSTNSRALRISRTDMF